MNISWGMIGTLIRPLFFGHLDRRGSNRYPRRVRDEQVEPDEG